FQLSGPSRLTLDGTWSYPFPLAVTGGTLTLAGNWRLSQPLVVRGANANLSSTTGSWGVSSVTAVNAGLNLGDGLHPADVQLDLTNSTISLVGRVDNVGRELLINAATGSWALRGGRIVGGRVRTTDGARLRIMSSSPSSFLDGIVLEGEMEMPSLFTQVYIRNGLTLNGTFFVGPGLDLSPAVVLFDGPQTVTSTSAGTIVLRGYLETVDSPPGPLTFAP